MLQNNECNISDVDSKFSEECNIEDPEVMNNQEVESQVKETIYTDEECADIEKYKKLISEAINKNHQNIDFGIDITNSKIAFKQISLLKKAYFEVMPNRDEIGFFGFLLRVIPLIGTMYGTYERNQINKEGKIKDQVTELLYQALCNHVNKMVNLENDIKEIKEQSREIQKQNKQLQRENRELKLQIHDVSQKHSEEMRELKAEMCYMSQQHSEQIDRMNVNFSSAFKAISKQISNIHGNTNAQENTWEMIARR